MILVFEKFGKKDMSVKLRDSRCNVEETSFRMVDECRMKMSLFKDASMQSLLDKNSVAYFRFIKCSFFFS